jgi:hypothetical protein
MGKVRQIIGIAENRFYIVLVPFRILPNKGMVLAIGDDIAIKIKRLDRYRLNTCFVLEQRRVIAT